MPKVLRIINRFNLGGPTYNVAYLSKYLEPEFETLLIGGAKDETEESSGFIVENLGLKPVIIEEMRREIDLKNDYAAYRKIKRIIQEFRPDIVHTHASKAGTLGRLAASACGVPVIIHTFHGHVFHSYFGKLTTAFYKMIERYLAKKSTMIIAISEKQKTELSEIHGICRSEKIRVVPLGFDLSKFRENMDQKRKDFRNRYRLEEDEIAVTIIGRLVPVKNHSLFLEAIREASGKSSKKIRAFIVGDGEERARIEARARELEIPFSDGPGDALLTFTSWIKDIDLALAGSDIIALTSFNEGTPVSLIEAQAAGKAIVTTDAGGVENVVVADETALLCRTTDSSEFASALIKLVEDNELRTRMASKGWEHVRNKFHFTRLITDVRNLYHELLEKR